MSFTVSIAYPDSGCSTIGSFSGRSGFSSDALEVAKRAASLLEFLDQSVALFGDKKRAIGELWDIANDYSDLNWDGCGARPVNPTSVSIAEVFIRALPRNIPLPEFAPEPDGSVSLDWMESRNRLFSISVNDSGRLAYTWLDGTNKGYAVESFDGATVPPRILDGIRQILRNGNVGIRTA